MENMNEIYEQYHKKVFCYFYGKTQDENLAQDLCSDVFMKILEKHDTFDEKKASASTWIYTIARNTLYDYFRTNHIHGEIDEFITDASDVELEVCNNETLSELADALLKLPERERKLLVMRYYNNISLKEIALRLSMSYSNVKIVHNKALENLRKFWPKN